MRYARWMSLAEREYTRILSLLHILPGDDWSRQTDCAEWLVRDVVAHLAGAAEATASVSEQIRQQRAGRARQGDRQRMEAVNEVQVEERASLTPDELIAALADAASRGLCSRRRLPLPVRLPRFPFPKPLGWCSLGHLNGAIYTRDAWMHRIDICHAAGQPVELTADHDGLIVADLVREWSVAEPDLVLTGPAGGHFGAASGRLNLDAVEFARALAGRIHVEGVAPAPELF